MNLERRAEVMKLARLLDDEPERFAYLEQLPADDLRELRERAEVVLHEDDGRLGRVALASKIPPLPLTAWIAQHLFGPLLCARITGLLETRRAIDLAKRMPPGFLAELAMQLDPRRAHDIIRGLPPGLIGRVAARLAERREWIAMGRFVGHMTDAALDASFDVIDDAGLLRISYFVEEKDQLDHVVGLLDVERVRGAIRAATAEDLWPQALDLLTRISDERAGTLADLASEEDANVLEGLIATAQRDGLWDVVLPVSQHMSDDGLRRLASMRELYEPEILRAVVDAAVAADLWETLQPLADLLAPEAQEIVFEQAPDGSG